MRLLLERGGLWNNQKLPNFSKAFSQSVSLLSPEEPTCRIYIHTSLCVCLCVHTETRAYAYIYVCVCVNIPMICYKELAYTVVGAG